MHDGGILRDEFYSPQDQTGGDRQQAGVVEAAFPLGEPVGSGAGARMVSMEAFS